MSIKLSETLFGVLVLRPSTLPFGTQQLDAHPTHSTPYEYVCVWHVYRLLPLPGMLTQQRATNSDPCLLGPPPCDLRPTSLRKSVSVPPAPPSISRAFSNDANIHTTTRI
jgi:hypothetical protein